MCVCNTANNYRTIQPKFIISISIYNVIKCFVVRCVCMLQAQYTYRIWLCQFECSVQCTHNLIECHSLAAIVVIVISVFWRNSPKYFMWPSLRERRKNRWHFCCVCVYICCWLTIAIRKWFGWDDFLFLFCFIRYYMRHHEKYYTKPSWNINVYRRVIHIPHSRAQIIYIY